LKVHCAPPSNDDARFPKITFFSAQQPLQYIHTPTANTEQQHPMRESSVRKQLKSWFGDHLYWVEQARGSTNGFPDTILAIAPLILAPIELKVATFGPDQHIKERLTDIYRPDQLGIHRRLSTQNQLAFTIFGQKATNLPQDFGIAHNFALISAIQLNLPLKINKVNDSRAVIGFIQTARRLYGA
jgi:hypothetical protein